MKNTIITHPIRYALPDLGNIPKGTPILNLEDHLEGKSASMVNIYPHIQNYLQANDIKIDDELNLYVVAPNQVLVTAVYLLTKMGYEVSFLPKPTTSKEWGFQNNPKNWDDPMSFIEPYSENITMATVNVGVSLSGRFKINGIKDVWQGDGILATQRIIQDDMADSTKIHITHRLTLPEIFESLTDRIACKQIQKDFKSILDELLDRKAKNVHVLSSIPAQGLLYFGQIIAREEYRDLNFFIYNYMDDGNYHLGDIISAESYQKIIKELENA